MCTQVKYYQNKTKIPDFLKPLPVIDKKYSMKHRISNYEPLTLVAMSCRVLMKIESQLLNYKSWNDFIEIFQNNARIIPDSYKRLCSILDPPSSTAFILTEAKRKNMKLDEYLKMLKILDDYNPSRIHLKISYRTRKFPITLVARIKKL